MKINVADTEKWRKKDFSYPYGADLKVLLFGTSMCENLSETLPYTFKKTRYYRLNSGKILPDESFKVARRFKQNILDFKPDIIIFCITINNFFSETYNLTKED